MTSSLADSQQGSSKQSTSKIRKSHLLNTRGWFMRNGV